MKYYYNGDEVDKKTFFKELKFDCDINGGNEVYKFYSKQFKKRFQEVYVICNGESFRTTNDR